MRYALLIALVLLVTPLTLHAEEPKAPAEDACIKALKELIEAARTADAERHLALGNAYGDPEAMAKAAFGEDYTKLPKLAQVRTRDLMVAFVFGGMLSRWGADAEKAGAVPQQYLSEALPKGRRKVSFRIGERDFAVLMLAGAEGPRIVDVGRDDRMVMAMIGAQYEAAGRMADERGERGQLNPLVFLILLVDKTRARAREVKTKDNLRSLAALILSRRTGSTWPAFSGKRFVVSVAAHKDLDTRRAENLAIFFSPTVAPANRARPVAYDGLAPKTLATTDVSKLTSYAGRRNGEEAYRITPEQEKEGTPILADLSLPNVAVVAFSNGEVRTLDRKALGLGPDDPIVAGDASKSPVLRLLSSE